MPKSFLPKWLNYFLFAWLLVLSFYFIHLLIEWFLKLSIFDQVSCVAGVFLILYFKKILGPEVSRG